MRIITVFVVAWMLVLTSASAQSPELCGVRLGMTPAEVIVALPTGKYAKLASEKTETGRNVTYVTLSEVLVHTFPVDRLEISFVDDSVSMIEAFTKELNRADDYSSGILDLYISDGTLAIMKLLYDTPVDRKGDDAIQQSVRHGTGVLDVVKEWKGDTWAWVAITRDIFKNNLTRIMIAIF